MLSEQILALLAGAGEGYLSGEAMSRELGVTRAAVWKCVAALREEGYDISSAPRLGYRLESGPDKLSPALVTAGLESGRVVGQTVECLDKVDSTNTYLKMLAGQGAGDGYAVLADCQTGGRGRRDRPFQSPSGGLYLSVLMKPDCPPVQAVNLTAWVAVAVCRGLEEACGAKAGIKWTNDIILNGKKLCGILTEMGVEGETGALQYVVAGVGVNVAQKEFPPELRDIAVSLEMAGYRPDRNKLAACLLKSFDRMYRAFPAGKQEYLERYRALCVTTGRQAVLLGPDGPLQAEALGIDDDFALRVRLADGTERTVSSGEVSVRGIAGYI